MKKHGFTLAELLVSLGIIAIGASLMAPIFLNARPDRYKFRVISCYNMANEATEALLSNPALYFRNPNNLNDTCTGLRCTLLPSTANPSGITLPAGTTPDCKYPLLMKEMLRIGTTATTCTNGTLSGNTPDKTNWAFKGSANSGYTLTITFPQNNGCGPYNAASCKNPNIFVFKVDPRGDITADSSDSLTKAYLNNMINIHKTETFSASDFSGN